MEEVSGEWDSAKRHLGFRTENGALSSSVGFKSLHDKDIGTGVRLLFLGLMP